MKYGIMEGFRMFNTKVAYGLVGDRISLFQKAKDLIWGFDGIEFGIALDYQTDSLWTGEGALRQSMKNAAEQTGVEAASICLHLLNYRERSPASDSAEHRKVAREIIEKTIEACTDIGASVILVPFFGTAALNSKNHVQRLVQEMKKCASIAEANKVCLGLETSLDAPEMRRIIEAIGSDYVQVYFDTGNAASIGYDVVKEIEELNEYIVQTHIKDNPPNRMLGKGSVDFEAAMKAFRQIGFDGYLMLETQSTDDFVYAAKPIFNTP